MNGDDFPRLRALLDGRLSMYAIEEWPMIRAELALFERDAEALREYAVRLLMAGQDGTDEGSARRIVASIKAPPRNA